MLWVLIDENPAGLNDAAFAFGMAAPAWFDLPGTYHNWGCGFAFADGHSETHRWLYHRAMQGGGTPISDSLEIQDWSWMAARTSAQ